jgi:hypothetical protein
MKMARKTNAPRIPIKQHAMLVDRRNRKKAENDNKHKDVVERQCLFDNVAREKLQAHLSRRRLRIKSRNLQESRVPSKLPRGVLVEGEVKCERQTDPYDAPNAGLAKRNSVSLAMENAKIQRQ